MSLDEKYEKMRKETLNDIAFVAVECHNSITVLLTLRKRLHHIMESGFACGMFPVQADPRILLIWREIASVHEALYTATYVAKGVLAEMEEGTKDAVPTA